MRVSDTATMTEAAKTTGGVAYTSRKDVAGAVRDALNDSRVVYVLRYTISDLKTDGKFHKINLDTRRKDVKLRYREGYFAPQVR
jgi:VWFA-related protein